MPGGLPGGVLNFRIDQRITWKISVCNVSINSFYCACRMSALYALHADSERGGKGDNYYSKCEA